MGVPLATAHASEQRGGSPVSQNSLFRVAQGSPPSPRRLRRRETAPGAGWSAWAPTGRPVDDQGSPMSRARADPEARGRKAQGTGAARAVAHDDPFACQLARNRGDAVAGARRVIGLRGGVSAARPRRAPGVPENRFASPVLGGAATNQQRLNQQQRAALVDRATAGGRSLGSLRPDAACMPTSASNSGTCCRSPPPARLFGTFHEGLRPKQLATGTLGSRGKLA
jgi:hypothetical protein